MLEECGYDNYQQLCVCVCACVYACVYACVCVWESATRNVKRFVRFYRQSLASVSVRVEFS